MIPEYPFTRNVAMSVTTFQATDISQLRQEGDRNALWYVIQIGFAPLLNAVYPIF